jgi:hypothetical protein
MWSGRSLNSLCCQLRVGSTLHSSSTVLSNLFEETSMGIKLDDSPRDCTDYQNAIYTFGYALTYRMVRPWLYNDSVFFNLTSLGKFTRKSIQTLHDFSRRVITEREKNFTDSSKPNKRMAMLDLLLSAKHNGADIDDDGIAEEVDTFMVTTPPPSPSPTSSSSWPTTPPPNKKSTTKWPQSWALRPKPRLTAISRS